MIKLDIFKEGRYYGTIRIKDRWRGLFAISEDEIRKEVESRLPTLRKSKYTVAFA